LEVGNLEYEIIEEFLIDLKNEFGEEDKELVKVAELKRLGQESKKNEGVCSRIQKNS